MYLFTRFDVPIRKVSITILVVCSVHLVPMANVNESIHFDNMMIFSCEPWMGNQKLKNIFFSKNLSSC